MCKLELAGRASKDGSTKNAGGYDIGTVGVAVSVPVGKESGVLFVDLEAFGPIGERLAKIKKGQQIWAICTGRTRKWTGRDNKDHWSTTWTPVALQVVESGTYEPATRNEKSDNDEEDDVKF